MPVGKVTDDWLDSGPTQSTYKTYSIGSSKFLLSATQEEEESRTDRALLVVASGKRDRTQGVLDSEMY